MTHLLACLRQACGTHVDLTCTVNVVCTLVTSEDFVIGAAVLGHSLKGKLGGTSALQVVLVTDNISLSSRQKLIAAGWDLIAEVGAVPNPCAKSKVHVGNWFDVGFTKLRVWELCGAVTTQLSYKAQLHVDEIFYIDADCIVCEDISEIFLMPKCVRFAAAPDLCPPNNFNAGVMYVKPSLDTFESLLKQMTTIGSYDGGDTGFLNQTTQFANWFDAKSFRPVTAQPDVDTYDMPVPSCGTHADDSVDEMHMRRLPFLWNAQRIMEWFTKSKAQYWDDCVMRQGVKIIHYSSSPKVWDIDPMQRITNKVHLIWHKQWLQLQQDCKWQDWQNVDLAEHLLTVTSKLEQLLQTRLDGAVDYPNWVGQVNSRRWDGLMCGDVSELSVGRITGDEQLERKWMRQYAEHFDAVVENAHCNKVVCSPSGLASGKFPKVLHQIWLGGVENMPEHYGIWQIQWASEYSTGDWEYILWDDNTLEKELGVGGSLYEHSGRLEELLAQCENWGEQSDVIRLFVLYVYGGIYVDMDFEVVRDMGLVLRLVDDWNLRCGGAGNGCGERIEFMCGMSNTGLFEVNNAFLASTVGNGLLEYLWDGVELERGVGEKMSGTDTLVRTGPIYLSRMLFGLDLERSGNVLVLPTAVMYSFPNSLRGWDNYVERRTVFDGVAVAVHHWGVSWLKVKDESVQGSDHDSGEMEKKEKDLCRKENVSDGLGDVGGAKLVGVGLPEGFSVLQQLMSKSGNDMGLQSKILNFM